MGGRLPRTALHGHFLRSARRHLARLRHRICRRVQRKRRGAAHRKLIRAPSLPRGRLPRGGRRAAALAPSADPRPSQRLRFFRAHPQGDAGELLRRQRQRLRLRHGRQADRRGGRSGADAAERLARRRRSLLQKGGGRLHALLLFGRRARTRLGARGRQRGSGHFGQRADGHRHHQ